MNLATIAYLPVRDFLYPKVFLENLKQFKMVHPLILFSDYRGKGYEDTIPIPDPNPMRKSKNKVALNNLLFLHALRIAKFMGIDRFIYLESDSRVGSHAWDGRMLHEAMRHPDAVSVGTPAIFNSLGITEYCRPAIMDYIQDYNLWTGLKVADFKPKSGQSKNGGCLFHMGSLCVYTTAELLKYFRPDDPKLDVTAQYLLAFDLHIGMWIRNKYGADAPLKLPFITRSFSSYGDKVMNLAKRKQLLESGKVVAVHQIKDKWKPHGPTGTNNPSLTGAGQAYQPSPA